MGQHEPLHQLQINLLTAKVIKPLKLRREYVCIDGRNRKNVAGTAWFI